MVKSKQKRIYKSLNSRTNNIFLMGFLMNKRGQLSLLIALGLIIVISGTIYTGSTISKTSTKVDDMNHIYLGDLNSNLVFDRTKCDIKLKNYVLFDSLEEAHSLGFKDIPNCV